MGNNKNQADCFTLMLNDHSMDLFITAGITFLLQHLTDIYCNAEMLRLSIVKRWPTY